MNTFRTRKPLVAQSNSMQAIYTILHRTAANAKPLRGAGSSKAKTISAISWKQPLQWFFAPSLTRPASEGRHYGS